MVGVVKRCVMLDSVISPCLYATQNIGMEVQLAVTAMAMSVHDSYVLHNALHGAAAKPAGPFFLQVS